MYNPQGGGITLQGGSGTVLQGSSPNLQPTYNPQQQSVGAVQGATTQTAPTQTPYYDAAAAQAAADRAAKIAQANAIKGSINGIINSVRGVYDAIYGDLNTVVADKANAVTSRYNKENTALVDQFNTDFPTIGNAYSARNTYDSSYRKDSEAGAQKQFENMADDLVTTRDEDMAKVGQWGDTQRAQVGADRGTLDTMQQLIAQSEDPDQLMAYQQQIADKLNQVSASRAGLRSQAAYKASADSLVNTADRSANLRQTLGNIIQGAAPAPLKRSVATKLIQNSGLPADQQAALVDDFEKQLLNGTDEQVIQQG